eukprot:COSAG04_NODE_4625_length_1985_cov_16.974549_2_plen_50_part_01
MHLHTAQPLLQRQPARRRSKFETLRKLIVKEFPDLPKLPKKGWKLHGGVN